jgi:hypothetical protein
MSKRIQRKPTATRKKTHYNNVDTVFGPVHNSGDTESIKYHGSYFYPAIQPRFQKSSYVPPLPIHREEDDEPQSPVISEDSDHEDDKRYQRMRHNLDIMDKQLNSRIRPKVESMIPEKWIAMNHEFGPKSPSFSYTLNKSALSSIVSRARDMAVSEVGKYVDGTSLTGYIRKITNLVAPYAFQEAYEMLTSRGTGESATAEATRVAVLAAYNVSNSLYKALRVRRNGRRSIGGGRGRGRRGGKKHKTRRFRR